MFSKSKKFKLCDLGLSRICKRQCSLNDSLYNANMKFLALELLQEMEMYNENNLPDLTKADIFALGITLYSLMICIY